MPHRTAVSIFVLSLACARPQPPASDGIAIAIAWRGHDGTNMSPTGDHIRLR